MRGSRKFCQWGPGKTTRNQPEQQPVLQRKLYFSKEPEGVQHFPGGSNFFKGGGGVQMLITIENGINCDFPGGGGGGGGSRPPIPPSGSAHAMNAQASLCKCTDLKEP